MIADESKKKNLWHCYQIHPRKPLEQLKVYVRKEVPSAAKQVIHFSKMLPRLLSYKKPKLVPRKANRGSPRALFVKNYKIYKKN